MIAKIRELLVKYWDIIIYLVFGVLTTAVNWMVYFPLYNWAGLSATVSTVIAWFFAVAFAFLTNKPFVFKSHDWSMKTVGPELTGFVGCRIGSGLMETAIIYVSVELLHWDGNIMKLVTAVLVIVLNYIGSKLLVFKKK